MGESYDGVDEAAQTTAEHVAASAAEGRRKPRRKPALAPDVPEGVCANCETRLVGPVCHECGQYADGFKRPVVNLLREALDGLFSLDGRLMRTLPALLARPGHVTRAYLRGRRARFMTPFKLYIIASLVFFLLAPLLVSGLNAPGVGEDFQMGFEAALEDVDALEASGEMSASDARIAREAIGAARAGDLGGFVGAAQRVEDDEAGETPPAASEDAAAADRSAPAAAAEEGSEEGAAEEGAAEEASAEAGAAPAGDAGSGVVGLRVDRARQGGEAAEADTTGMRIGGMDARLSADTSSLPAWVPQSWTEGLEARAQRALADPEAWLAATGRWIPRVLFVMTPVFALLLALVYAWRRGFFYFDHLVVSLHFHAALFLAMAIGVVAGPLLGGWAALILLVYANVYLYRMQRVVYGRGRISSVLRTFTLDVLYGIVLLHALAAVILLGVISV